MADSHHTASAPARSTGNRVGPTGVVFVPNNNMAPTLNRNSVAFLGERNRWCGDGLYCLPDPDTGEPIQVYRVQAARIWVKRAVRCGLDPRAIVQPDGSTWVGCIVPHGPLKPKNPPKLTDIRSMNAVIRELQRLGRWHVVPPMKDEGRNAQ